MFKNFFQQFWPAFVATVVGGVIILGLTIYFQSRPAQSGTILYNVESAPTYFESEEGSLNLLGRRTGTVIRFMNIGDTDLKDFQIAIKGFSPNDDLRENFSVDFEKSLLTSPISKKSIDDNGVLRLNFSRFDAEGEAVVKFDSSFGLSLEIQSSSPDISLVRVGPYNTRIRQSGGYGLWISLVAALLGLTTSIFSIFMSKRTLDA